MKRAALFTAVLLGGLVGPVAAQTGVRQPPPSEAVVAEPQHQPADIVSLDRIRKGLERPGPVRMDAQGTSVRESTRPSVARDARGLPVFRLEVFGYQPTTLRDSLQASVADAWPPARPGYLDWNVPGATSAMTPPLVSVSVSFDIVRSARKWAYKRAVAKAKREVAEELARLGIR